MFDSVLWVGADQNHKLQNTNLKQFPMTKIQNSELGMACIGHHFSLQSVAKNILYRVM